MYKVPTPYTVGRKVGNLRWQLSPTKTTVTSSAFQYIYHCLSTGLLIWKPSGYYYFPDNQSSLKNHFKKRQDNPTGRRWQAFMKHADCARMLQLLTWRSWRTTRKRSCAPQTILRSIRPSTNLNNWCRNRPWPWKSSWSQTMKASVQSDTQDNHRTGCNAIFSETSEQSASFR